MANTENLGPHSTFQGQEFFNTFKKLPMSLLVSIETLKQAIHRDLPQHTFNMPTNDIHNTFKIEEFQIDSIRILINKEFTEISKLSESQFIQSYSPFLLFKIQVSVASKGFLNFLKPRTKFKFLGSFSLVLHSFEYFKYYPEMFLSKQNNESCNTLEFYTAQYNHNISKVENAINIISVGKKVALEREINDDFMIPDNFKKYTLALGDIQPKFPLTSQLITQNYCGLAISSSTCLSSLRIMALGDNIESYPPLVKAFSYLSLSKQHTYHLKKVFTLDLQRRGINQDRITECLVYDPDFLTQMKDTISLSPVPRSYLICRDKSDYSKFCKHHSFGYTSTKLYGHLYHEIILALTKHYTDRLCARTQIKNEKDIEFFSSLYIIIFEYMLLRNANIQIEQSVLMYRVLSAFINFGKPFDLQRNAVTDPSFVTYKDYKLSCETNPICEDPAIPQSSFSNLSFQFDELFYAVKPAIQAHFSTNFNDQDKHFQRLPDPEWLFISILKSILLQQS